MEAEKVNETAEKVNETAEMVLSHVEELPKTIVRRLVKNKLSQLSSDCEISVLRDSLQAFSESARIFIHYLSAAANDICKESNRQIISAEDVFKALEEIEFTEFIAPLRASLEEFRRKNGGRKSGSSKAKDINKKAKKNEPSACNGDGIKQQEDDNNDDGNSSD
ncbi:DNA polymerase epsilon subunit D [Dorcoceras hygrometricum]|uniref:DNA polymerase epsilon subunit D n=1 Tax=Dorcoceras hygrometricum TaxID=472368 RepID=A0A2Z7C4B5_9LAMI|nr:DNA polymerase epsilon subunit D [Dorcoceras hygrometricum]